MGHGRHPLTVGDGFRLGFGIAVWMALVIAGLYCVWVAGVTGAFRVR